MADIQVRVARSSDPHFKLIRVAKHRSTRNPLRVAALVVFLLGGIAGVLFYFYPQAFEQITQGFAKQGDESGMSAPVFASAGGTGQSAPSAQLTSPTASSVIAAPPPAVLPPSMSMSTEPPPASEIPPPSENEVEAALPPVMSARTRADVLPMHPTPEVAETEVPAEIQVRVKQAFAHIEALRLHEPVGSNAYALYLELKEAAPDAATRVLDSILLQYLKQTEIAVEDGDFVSAEEILRRVQETAPQHQITTALRNRIVAGLNDRIAAQLTSRRNLLGEDSVFVTFDKLRELAPQHETTVHAAQQLIDALLDLSKRQLERRKYTTPENDNAYDSLRAVLSINEDNEEARAGLKVIADKYAFMSKEALDKGRPRKALKFIGRGLSVMPEHDELQALQKTVAAKLD